MSVTATVQITAAVGGDTGPLHVIVSKNSWRSLLPHVIYHIQCLNHSPFPQRVPEGTANITSGFQHLKGPDLFFDQYSSGVASNAWKQRDQNKCREIRSWYVESTLVNVLCFH